MGEVIQLQGDQRKDVQEFLVDKKEGLELDAKTIKVCQPAFNVPSVFDLIVSIRSTDSRALPPTPHRILIGGSVGKLTNLASMLPCDGCGSKFEGGVALVDTM